jgi:hypothetical protein
MTTRAPPTVKEVRERLQAAGHYVTIEGRLTEHTAATFIPCPASRLRRWRLEAGGRAPAGEDALYHLDDVLDWNETEEPLVDSCSYSVLSRWRSIKHQPDLRTYEN